MMNLKRESRFGMARLGAVALAAFILGGRAAYADVVTNRWIASSGGWWWTTNETTGVLTSWEGGLTKLSDVTHTVADFSTLESGGCVRSSRMWAVASEGMIFRPADSAAGEWDPATGAPLWFIDEVNSADYWGFAFCTHARDYFPLNVSDGWLVIGSNARINPGTSDGGQTWGPIRKEGNGYLRLSEFFRCTAPNHVLEIEDGKVFPMLPDALAYTDVRVTKPAGELVLTNFSSRTILGALTPWPGTEVPLTGNELQMGLMSPAILPGEVCGTGRVTAVTHTLSVTNVRPNLVYGARAGRLRLDSTTSAARPFACYDFEESLVADSSGNRRDLTAQGTVTRVQDAARGGWVAHFEATADSGGGLAVQVPGVSELTGNADYTVSFWARVASPCANPFPVFFSLGWGPYYQKTVQFRFGDASCTSLVFGQWGAPGDFTGIRPAFDLADWDPAAWHHYAAMREGGSYAVYVDGGCVFATTGVDLTLQLGSPA